MVVGDSPIAFNRFAAIEPQHVHKEGSGSSGAATKTGYVVCQIYPGVTPGDLAGR